MSKKKIIILCILVILLAITVLYETFATSTTTEKTSDNTYTITLNDSSTVSVPANSSKTIYYQLCNTNKGTVKYGVGYTTDNTDVTVKVYANSTDPEQGTIDYGENKFVKLKVINNSTTDSTAVLSTVLGYKNGGDLIVPSGVTLVTEQVREPVNLISYITNLYTSANPTLITQGTSNDTYYYSYQDTAKTWGLMNDGFKIDNSKDATTTSLAVAITDTTSLTSGTEGNIRYFGPSASVNNYIYFNCSDYSNQSSSTCELWRIIGVFDGKVKIIRNDSIGSLAWDQDKNQNSSLTTYSNNWQTSSLQLMLNSSYYNGDTAGTITYYSGSSGTTSTSLNMSNIGIKNDTTRNMISESIWYLGGYENVKLYSNDIYTYERTNTVGTTIYNGNPFTITANIGLMYASDYGYATDLSKCSSQLSAYDSSTNSYACRANNWLFNSASTWLITPYSSNSNDAWHVYSSGDVGSVIVYGAYGVRPVLYLNSELCIESEGEGTSTNPYRISVS